MLIQDRYGRPIESSGPALDDIFSTPLVSGSRRGDSLIRATPYVKDAQGHEHKGKGPGGGQFTSGGGGSSAVRDAAGSPRQAAEGRGRTKSIADAASRIEVTDDRGSFRPSYETIEDKMPLGDFRRMERELGNNRNDPQSKAQWLDAWYADNQGRFQQELEQSKGEVEDGKWGVDSDGDRVFNFQTSQGTAYQIFVTENYGGQGTADVSFAIKGTPKGKGNYKITGTGGAHEVFSSVTAAVTALVLKTKPPVLSFTAAEPSRMKLYDRLVRSVASLAPEYDAVAVSSPGKPRRYLVVERSKMGELSKMLAGSEDGRVEPLLARYAADQTRVNVLPPATPEEVEQWQTRQAWDEAFSDIQTPYRASRRTVSYVKDAHGHEHKGKGPGGGQFTGSGGGSSSSEAGEPTDVQDSFGSPVRAATPEVKNWEQSIKWWYEVPYETAEAVRSFQGTTADSLNTSLRKGTPLRPKDAEVDAALTSLADSGKFNASGTFVRGIPYDPKLKVGDVFENPAWGSTSADMDVARRFAVTGGTAGYAEVDPHILRIKSDQGLLIGGPETEILLKKGGKFKVVSVGEEQFNKNNWSDEKASFKVIDLVQLPSVPEVQDRYGRPLFSGSRRGVAPSGATPYRRPIPYVQDAHGHEHKGKGPGGGQFTSSSGEDRPQDSGRPAETKPNKVDQESFKTPDADTTERVRDLAARNLAESWQVSQEDLAELAKEDHATYSTKEDAAWEFLRSWASSSGGPIPTAAATAVCDSLGLPYKFHSQSQAKINDYIRKRPGLNRATASFGKAMYDATQKWLAERGITEVELVRGGTNPDETGQPASSWSTSMAGVRGADRGLYREKIPSWRILSVPSTGFGTLHESEVVVLPKPSQSQAVQDSYGRPLSPTLYTHAPKGGVTIKGKFFKGGEFIPAEVLVNATEEERRAVESGESRGKPLPPEGGVREPKTVVDSTKQNAQEPYRPIQPASRGYTPTVDGREVLPDVPNMNSIDSSVEDPEVLPGIYEIPMSAFDPDYKPRPHSTQERQRLDKLKTAIGHNKQISPLVAEYGRPIPYVQDAHGHEHKGKGPGGGQFTSGGGDGSSIVQDTTRSPSQAAGGRGRTKSIADTASRIEVTDDRGAFRPSYDAIEDKMPLGDFRRMERELGDNKNDPQSRAQWLDAWYVNNQGRFQQELERSKGDVEDGKWGIDSDGDRVFNFSTSHGTAYQIFVTENYGGQGTADVSFAIKGTPKGKGNYKITGTGGAHEVFSSVTAAVTALALKTRPPVLSFTAAEPSRMKLYDRLVRSVASLAPEYDAIAISSPGKPRRYLVVEKSKMGELSKMLAGSEDARVEPLLAKYAADLTRVDVLPPAAPEEIEQWQTQQAWEDADPDTQYRASRRTVSYAFELQDSYGRPISPTSYAHAPAGGVTVKGKFFKGGEFIPAEVLVDASPEERAAVESGESRGKPLPPEGGVKEPKQKKVAKSSPLPKVSNWEQSIKWWNEVPYETAEAVRSFQGMAADSLNTALRKGTPLSPRDAKVDAALTSLADEGKFTASGTFVRGIPYDPKLKVGDTFENPMWGSTSADMDIARRFAVTGGTAGYTEVDPHILRIRSDQGLLIGGPETEVLLKKGSKFKVVSVGEEQFNKNSWSDEKASFKIIDLVQE